MEFKIDGKGLPTTVLKKTGVFLKVSLHRRIPPAAYGYFILFLTWAWVLATGLGGIDFGIHWDEYLLQNSITWSIHHHTLFPQWVYYPAVMNYLGLLSLIPDVLTSFLHGARLIDDFFLILEKISVLPEFLIRIRMVSLVVSSFAMVWIYIGMVKWRKHPFESYVAAALVGLSWEIQYHSRWFAPDTVMMQFGALGIGLVLSSFNSQKRILILRLAAASFGLMIATKYNGAVLALLVFPAGWWASRDMGESRQKSLVTMIELGLIIVLVFLIFNFKLIIDPKKSIVQILFNVAHYRHMEHSGYNVKNGFPHLWKMGTYLFLVCFSKFPLIAGLFSFFSISGMIEFIRTKNRFGFVLGLVPLVYVLFLSQNIVMVVRNILIVIPFLAILSAVGLSYWESRIFRSGWIRWMRLGVGGCLLINAGWLLYAMISVRNRDTIDQGAQLAAYIDHRPRRLFLLSSMSVDLLKAHDNRMRSNVTTTWSDDIDDVVFNTFEAKGRWDGRWSPNTFQFAETWMGSYEVNLNYYPTWLGNHKFVVMKPQNAKMVFSPEIPSKKGLKPHVVPGYD